MKKELTKGRKFDIYEKLMDGAIRQKMRDIFPWVKGSVVVDAGFGTGLLLKYLAKKFPKRELVGLDISSHFIAAAQKEFKNRKSVRVINADVVSKSMPQNSVDTKIFATVLHEVYSYNNYKKSFVAKALRSAFQELKTGGRIIIRDGIKPKKQKVYVWFRDDDGVKNSYRSPAKLNTEALFIRFARDFKRGAGVVYSVTHARQKRFYGMQSDAAYEFLSKKEYRANWKQEVQEQFGYMDLQGYVSLLKKIGFRVLYAKCYTNPWILKNWWQGKVLLCKRNKKGKLVPLPFFPTTVVLVAEKPGKSRLKKPL